MADHLRLVADLEALLYRHDPIGIAVGGNRDEYSPEAGSIVPRLRDVETVEDVRRIVHEEFVHWFDDDTAGPAGRYQTIAEELWARLEVG
ncbi:hypothetical protein [Blastococcus tunisiensis]|uniref:Uncharacterized protein n=1 Tax=Blastococcus tunisiensis TaxID=1798228 RepID=A0A1I2CDC2_9ACTN|nr:hypothetical protein [Blastococcus sp. DSM 46838]SFE66192.1 hypothetical protein SAMN05216574_10537 [Blastococcus sp. DSM 46838]